MPIPIRKEWAINDGEADSLNGLNFFLPPSNVLNFSKGQRICDNEFLVPCRFGQ